MVKTVYNANKHDIQSPIECSQYDIVQRDGIISIKDQVRTLNARGIPLNNVEEETEFIEGEATESYKESFDIIDAERRDREYAESLRDENERLLNEIEELRKGGITNESNQSNSNAINPNVQHDSM